MERQLLVPDTSQFFAASTEYSAQQDVHPRPKAIAPLVFMRNIAHGALRFALGGDGEGIAKDVLEHPNSVKAKFEIPWAISTASAVVFMSEERILRAIDGYADRATKSMLRRGVRFLVSSTTGFNLDLASDVSQSYEMLAEEALRIRATAVTAAVTAADATPALPTPGLDVNITRNATQLHSITVRTPILRGIMRMIADPAVARQAKIEMITLMTKQYSGNQNVFLSLDLGAMQAKMESLDGIIKSTRDERTTLKSNYDDTQMALSKRRLRTKDLETQLRNMEKDALKLEMREVFTMARLGDLAALTQIRYQALAQGLLQPTEGDFAPVELN